MTIHRHFGVASRTALGGAEQPSGFVRDAIQTRNIIRLPAQHPPYGAVDSVDSSRPLFIQSTSSPFKRGKLSQALIDILCVFVGVLVVCITAASFPVGLFILLFVSLR